MCVTRRVPFRWPLPTTGEVLLRTFTEIRDELVSTLWFVLGNQEDAQDVAQEAFLRCWRTQEGQAENRKTCGPGSFASLSNAAKDLQRTRLAPAGETSAGSRYDADSEAAPLTQGLEEQESLQQLRQALLAPATRGKGSVPVTAKRRADLRADRRDAQPPRGHRQNPDERALQKLRKVLGVSPESQ